MVMLLMLKNGKQTKGTSKESRRFFADNLNKKWGRVRYTANFQLFYDVSVGFSACNEIL